MSPSKCFKCLFNFYLSDADKFCYSTCPDGCYADQISKICKKCDNKCSKCFNGSDTQCLECITPYKLYGQNCISECPKNTTIQNSNCIGIIFYIKKKINFNFSLLKLLRSLRSIISSKMSPMPKELFSFLARFKFYCVHNVQ